MRSRSRDRLFTVLATVVAATTALVLVTRDDEEPTGTLAPMDVETSYALNITVEDTSGDRHYCTERTFKNHPEPGMVIALKTEAVDVYRGLFNDEPDEISLHVSTIEHAVAEISVD